MHLRWKKRHVQGYPHPHTNCDHTEPTTTLTPILCLFVGGKHTTVWRVGPGIRQCCIDAEKSKARASWWADVELRFQELETIGLDDEVATAGIRAARQDILKLLKAVVPRPATKTVARAAAKGRRGRHPYHAQTTLLRVSWPCTEAELTQAWRKVARERHPDRGGAQAAFVEAQAAYSKLKTALQTCLKTASSA